MKYCKIKLLYDKRKIRNNYAYTYIHVEMVEDTEEIGKHLVGYGEGAVECVYV